MFLSVFFNIELSVIDAFVTFIIKHNKFKKTFLLFIEQVLEVLCTLITVNTLE